MPWNKLYIVAERPELLANGADQRRIVTAWQVRTPNRTLKQDIADDSQAALRMEENHMTGGVTGAMPNLKLNIAENDRIALLQPAIGHKRPGFQKAVLLGAHGQQIEPKPVFLVWTFDRYFQPISKFPHTADMIDVSMGDQNFFDIDLHLVRRAENPVEIAARVHDCRPAGFLATQQRAVLGERSNRNNISFHRVTENRSVSI